MRDKLRILIVGGGFAGLAAARGLRDAPVEVVLVDRNNHHVFQPLLYQVATAVLAPSQIASPIRELLRKQPNTTVILGSVTGVDRDRRVVTMDTVERRGVSLSYDVLVLATGARQSYFGHQEFESFAPGLKSLTDATAIRNRILRAFEQAEAEEDPARHRDLLTFVLVGAGPTGVEMAAAIAGLVANTLKGEFRRVNPQMARVVLVDMMPRVLGNFDESLGVAARRRLEALRVELVLGHGVEAVDEDGVTVGGERIPAKTVIWTAGVTPSPAGAWLGAPTDKLGRVIVSSDLSLPEDQDVFVIGDTANAQQDGRPLPGVAQVAMQQGSYVGRLLSARFAGRQRPPAFRYSDRGTMAVVGKGFAVLERGKVRLSGAVPWMVWLVVHLEFLAQAYLRTGVLLYWIWTHLTGRRGARLIVARAPNEADAVSSTLVTRSSTS